jgi:hypothetical protein
VAGGAVRSPRRAEIESSRRLVVLVSELDQHLVEVPAATRWSLARFVRAWEGGVARDWATSRKKEEV